MGAARVPPAPALPGGRPGRVGAVAYRRVSYAAAADPPAAAVETIPHPRAAARPARRHSPHRMGRGTVLSVLVLAGDRRLGGGRRSRASLHRTDEVRAIGVLRGRLPRPRPPTGNRVLFDR